MARLQKPVQTLTALDKEIYRLRLHAKKQEKKMDANVRFLKENFGGMLYNSIFRQHYDSGATMLKTKFAEGIWNNEKLQHSLGKLIDHLLHKFAEGIDRFTRKNEASTEAGD